MPAPRVVRRVVCFTLLAATALTACDRWVVQPVSPEQVLTAQHPSAVQVQRSDSSRVVLQNPRIGADSLLGTTKGTPTGVPLADIAQVAVRRTDWGKTIGLLAIIAIPIVLVAVAASAFDQ